MKSSLGRGLIFVGRRTISDNPSTTTFFFFHTDTQLSDGCKGLVRGLTVFFVPFIEQKSVILVLWLFVRHFLNGGGCLRFEVYILGKQQEFGDWSLLMLFACFRREYGFDDAHSTCGLCSVGVFDSVRLCLEAKALTQPRHNTATLSPCRWSGYGCFRLWG
jgi:hypothetical protein